MNMTKLAETQKCQQCKKILNACLFQSENKKYKKCNICRNNINSKYRKDICETCGIRASFNYKEFKNGRFCKEHSLINMVNVTSKKCKYDNCNTQPNYGFIKDNIILYCLKHKTEDMVDLRHKKCMFENCKIRPAYNYVNELTPIFCDKHKLENMVNIIDKKCEYIGCVIRPTYNYKENKTARFCAKHKLENMIDVSNNTCIHESCNKNSNFNFKGEKKGIYCSSHKLEGMVDLKHKTCIYDNCTKNPNFNLEGEKKGIYCFSHKLENMVNVVSSKCEIDNCNVQVTYGYCGQMRTRCFKHKDNNMFKNPKKVCIEEDCKDIATYGVKEPTRCEDHSTKDEICLLSSTCKGCGSVDEIVTREGLCVTKCDITKSFEQYKKQQKIKEEIMLRYLDENINIKSNILEIKDDRIVNSFCNTYRPDRIYDCGTHMVIVECDEEQHKYKSYCSTFRDLKQAELSRMHEIQNAAGINCVFIRWNPDNYRLNGNLDKRYNMKERLKVLVKWIEYCFTIKPKKEISQVQYKYLFYDNYNINDTSFLFIDDIELYNPTIKAEMAV